MGGAMKARWVLAGLAAAFMLICVVCVGLYAVGYLVHEESKAVGDVVDKGYYSFDPMTLLSVIDDGQGLHVEATEPPGELVPTTVSWTEHDFHRVAVAIATPRQIEGLNLTEVAFHLPCDYVDHGPETMRFTFSDTARGSAEKPHREVKTRIEMSTGRAYWWVWEHYPAYSIPSSIEWLELPVGAADALEVAERQGGATYRNTVNDACKIHGYLVWGKWSVRYTALEETTCFEARIDAETGKHSVGSCD